MGHTLNGTTSPHSVTGIKSSKVNFLTSYITAVKKYKGLVTREIKFLRPVRNTVGNTSSIFQDEISQTVDLSG